MRKKPGHRRVQSDPFSLPSHGLLTELGMASFRGDTHTHLQQQEQKHMQPPQNQQQQQQKPQSRVPSTFMNRPRSRTGESAISIGLKKSKSPKRNFAHPPLSSRSSMSLGRSEDRSRTFRGIDAADGGSARKYSSEYDDENDEDEDDDEEEDYDDGADDEDGDDDYGDGHYGARISGSSLSRRRRRHRRHRRVRGQHQRRRPLPLEPTHYFDDDSASWD